MSRREDGWENFYSEHFFHNSTALEKPSHTVCPFSLLQGTRGVDLDFQRERGGGQLRTPVCEGSFPFRGFLDPHVLRICGYGYGVTSSLKPLKAVRSSGGKGGLAED